MNVPTVAQPSDVLGRAIDIYNEVAADPEVAIAAYGIAVAFVCEQLEVRLATGVLMFNAELRDRYGSS